MMFVICEVIVLLNVVSVVFMCFDPPTRLATLYCIACFYALTDTLRSPCAYARPMLTLRVPYAINIYNNTHKQPYHGVFFTLFLSEGLLKAIGCFYKAKNLLL